MDVPLVEMEDGVAVSRPLDPGLESASLESRDIQLYRWSVGVTLPLLVEKEDGVAVLRLGIGLESAIQLYMETSASGVSCCGGGT